MTKKNDSLSLEKIEDWIKNEFGQKLEIDVSISEALFKIQGEKNYKVEINYSTEDIGKIVDSALLATGFIDLKFSVVNSKSPSASANKSTQDKDFGSWLLKLAGDQIFILDTNTILNRTFTTIDSMLSSGLLTNIVIQIPRLVILEMERKANETNKKKLLEKRKTFLGYAEVSNLKNFGAQTMSELHRETLIDFSQISGVQHTDALIRREIKDAKRKALELDVVNSYTLVTSDMVNSFSAIAEGIDTMYVSKVSNWKDTIRNGNLSQILKLLTTVAVLFEKINVTINSKKFLFNGIWNGKTTSDWLEQIIQIKEI